eukprot:scaffold270_cov347-Pavlova_lutheri.AAC.4
MVKREELPSRAGDVWVQSFQLRRPYSCRFRQSILPSSRQKELAQCSGAPSMQCRFACVRAVFPPRVHFLFRKVDRTQYAIVDSLLMLHILEPLPILGGQLDNTTPAEGTMRRECRLHDPEWDSQGQGQFHGIIEVGSVPDCPYNMSTPCGHSGRCRHLKRLTLDMRATWNTEGIRSVSRLLPQRVDLGLACGSNGQDAFEDL